MSWELLESRELAGWVQTAALHSLIAGALIWIVVRSGRKFGPTAISFFGRIGVVTMLLLPLPLLMTAQLARKDIPVFAQRETLTIPVSIIPSPASTVEPIADLESPADYRDYKTIVTNSLGAVWLLGSALMLARTLVILGRVIRFRQKLNRLQSDSGLAKLLQELGVDPKQIRVSNQAIPPFVTGFWSPVMVLPADLISIVSRKEASMVIRHELAHLQRNDLRWAVFSQAAKVLHWWQPFVRMFVREMDAAIEGICDSKALQKSNSTTYANCLVNLAEKMSRPVSQTFALSVTGDFERLKQRLLWITEGHSELSARGMRLIRTSGILLLFGTIGSLVLVNAGAELPATVHTKDKGDGKTSSKIGDIEILSRESTIFDGDSGKIVFNDVKIVTKHYICRSPRAVFTRNPNDPKNLAKATLTLTGGVIANIRKKLGLSEIAKIDLVDHSIELTGFPRVSEGTRATVAEEKDAKIKYIFDDSGNFFVSVIGKTKSILYQAKGPDIFEPALDEVDIEADSTSYKNGSAIANGNVRVKFKKDVFFTADHMTFKRSSGEVILRGNVTASFHGQKATGSYMMFKPNGDNLIVIGPGIINNESFLLDDKSITITKSGLNEIFPPEDPSRLEIGEFFNWRQLIGERQFSLSPQDKDLYAPYLGK